MQSRPSRTENNSDLINRLGIIFKEPKPNIKAAWNFLNRVVPTGTFSIQFVHQNQEGHGMHKTFNGDDFEEFVSCIQSLNSIETRCNVYFDPNSSGYLGQTKRDNSNCFDYLALSLEHTFNTLTIPELKKEIHRDMIFPERRPEGLPLPTALWGTGVGCAALWRMNRPMGLSQGLDTGDVVACVLENEDYFAYNQKYVQLPYTINWPNIQLLDLGEMPELIKVQKPFCNLSCPAEHDWFAFRWLIENADEFLAEYDET